MMAGFILFFVCVLECLVIYIAFYSDVSECKQCMDGSDVNRNLGKPLDKGWNGGRI